MTAFGDIDWAFVICLLFAGGLLAALKQASIAAEKILYSLLSLHPQEFEVLKDHGLTRAGIEETMNAALLARHRVTCAEAQTLETANAQGVI